MTFFSKRKRENDDPPRFPAWIIVAFAIGLVIVVVIVSQSQPVGSVTTSATHNFASGEIELTATAIIKQATSLAQGTPQSDAAPVITTFDPIALTATYIVGQATALAQGTPQPAAVPENNANLDPFEITATYIVKQITEQASTPNS